jgi:hypothetical protein
VGADPTESVHVTVDARGVVADLEVAQRWRNRLLVEGFAAAVFDAYTTARERAVEAFTLAMLAAERVGKDPPRPPTARLPDRPASTAQPAAPTYRRGETPRFRYYTGPYACLTAVLHGRAVAGLIGDLLKIRYAETEFLQEEALDVLSGRDRRKETAVAPAGAADAQPELGLSPISEAADALTGKVDEMVETFNSTAWMRGLIPNLFIRHHLEKALDVMPALVEELDDAVDRYALAAVFGQLETIVTELASVVGSPLSIQDAVELVADIAS